MSKRKVKEMSEIASEEMAETIYKKGCLVFLDVRKWGATAKILDSIVEEKFGEDKKVVSAMQKLLTPDDKMLLERLSSIKNEAHGLIYRCSIQSPIPGFYFILKSSIVDINDELKSKQEQYLEVSEDFCSSIAEMEKRFEKEFPNMYRKDKYPSEATLRTRFRFRWSFKTINAPDKDLGLLDPELYENEQRKFKQEVQEMKNATLSLVKKSFIERLDFLKAQCDDEKINSATLKSIDSMLDKFDNLWGDFIDSEKVKKTISDLKEYMDGTDAEMLKSDDEFRKLIGTKADEVVKDLKKVEESKVDSSRFIDF